MTTTRIRESGVSGVVEGRGRALAVAVAAVASGSAAASVLIVAAGILAARAIGPAEFGKYFIALSGANLIALFSGYGIASACAYELTRRNSDVMHRALFVLLFSLPLSVALWVGVTSVLGEAARGLDVIVWGSLLGGALSVYLVAEGTLKGVRSYRMLAWCRTAGALLFLALIAVASSMQLRSFVLPASARGISLIVIGVTVFALATGRGTDYTPAAHSYRNFVSYALAATAGTLISVTLLYADKLVLSRSLSAADIGVYSAYFLPSYLLLGRAGEAAISVLFPERAASAPSDRLTRELWLVLALVGVALGACSLLAQWLTFLLLGDAYPFRWSLALLFATGATAFGIADVQWWLNAGSGARGASIFGLSGFALTVVLVVGLSFASSRWGIGGAAAIMCVASTLSLAMARLTAAVES
ncbi:MAG: lipopolysaccharide biosynthesis protein [Gemmatimonadota bacterium]